MGSGFSSEDTIMSIALWHDMNSAALIVGAYAISMILFAVWARRDLEKDDESYFLAGRQLTGPVLLVTMAATNFSAFTVYGSSGASYKVGLSLLPIMAFGTGFMAISMYFIGLGVRKRSVQHGAMTAPEMIRGQTGSREAQITMSIVLIAATIPYLALQPRAAGIVVSALFGGPEWIGAVLVTVLVVAYTLTGGLKAVVRTDLLQGIIAVCLLWVGLAMVIKDAGGLDTAMSSLVSSEATSGLLKREGNYDLLVWTSIMLLWLFADPMFPQLYQRLCAAENDRSIGQMATLYPAVAWLAFLPPILIGTLGNFSHPSLDSSDSILPAMIIDAGGEWLGGLVLVAGLAALMSTMDSQLLATGSLITRDLMSKEEDGVGIRNREIIIVLLAILGLILSLWSDLSILDLGLLAFSMYAVMYPSVFLAVHCEFVDGRAVISSIIAGESVVMLALFKPELFEGWWVQPVGSAMPAAVIPSLAAALFFLLLTNYYLSSEGFGLSIDFSKSKKIWFPAVSLTIVFIMAQDFWWWSESQPGLLGMPIWIWWSFALSVIQTGIMVKWTSEVH